MQFIKENNLDFEYYSSINTDLPVQYNPQKLSQILSELKEVPIKTISAMKEVLVNRKIQRIQAHSPEHVTNILKSLCIDNKNPAEYYQGGRRIVDPEFSRTIFISPESKHGMYYVKVKPKCKNQESERYMMDKNGNILAKMSTPDAIRLFERRCSELFVK